MGPSAPFFSHGALGVHTVLNRMYHMRTRYDSPEARHLHNADPVKFGSSTNRDGFVVAIR